jgi:5-methylcytosine-specific restriction endonuclease McrA
VNYRRYRYRDPILVRERDFWEAIRSRFPRWYRYDLRSDSYSVLKQILDELELAKREIELKVPERDLLKIEIARVESEIKLLKDARFQLSWEFERSFSLMEAITGNVRSQKRKDLAAKIAKMDEAIATLEKPFTELGDRIRQLERLDRNLELFEWYRGKVEPIAIRRKDTEDAWNQLRNRAAQNSAQIRDAAHIIKDRIKAQHCCPYCGGELGDVPHADHIYPVSKGGRSTERNMVYVCAQCNKDKSDLTLSAYIRQFNLDRDAIEARLSRMGKDF